MIKIGGKTIYHAGDTCLFGDMQLIAQRTPVDIAILPIGGHYTMDRHDAAYAAGLIGAATVIPCHYNTFPPIETDAEAFKADVEAQSSSEVVILEPGETPSELLRSYSSCLGPRANQKRRSCQSCSHQDDAGRREERAHEAVMEALRADPDAPVVGVIADDAGGELMDRLGAHVALRILWVPPPISA